MREKWIMKDEIIEAIKAALLPELTALRQGQGELNIGLADIKAEIKVINGRLDRMDERFDQMDKRLDDMKADMDKRFEQVDKRFDQMERRLQEVHEDIREVRSYVWTGGYERAKAERQSAVQEDKGTYDPKEKPGKG